MSAVIFGGGKLECVFIAEVGGVGGSFDARVGGKGYEARWPLYRWHPSCRYQMFLRSSFRCVVLFALTVSAVMLKAVVLNRRWEGLRL